MEAAREMLCASPSAGTVDRLSNLPEPILHHILSFLDMRYVIPTSLLSRKWRYLWTFLPFLTFNQGVFLHSLASISIGSPFRDFTHFVNRVMLFRQSSRIQSLRLYWGYGFCSSSFIDSWMRAAILRNVQELDIQIATKKHYFELPESLYTCKSLASLQLALCGSLGYDEPCIIIPIPESIHLPALRNLSLKSIDCMRNEFLDLYFSGCPLLEKLTLTACNLDPKSLTISAHQLKHLRIDIFDKGSSRPYDCKILISAPNLVSFACSDYISHDYSLENLSSLEMANLYMETEEHGYNSESDYFLESDNSESESDMVEGPTCKDNSKSDVDAPDFPEKDVNLMMKCLKGLYNVKSLTLNYTVLQVVSETTDVLRRTSITFRNLRYLKLIIWISKACVRGIMYLLEHTCNIETLVIEVVSIKPESVNIEEYLGEEWLLQHLRIIEVRNVQGCIDHELGFLKTLLKHTVKLEKLILSISNKWSTINEESMKSFTEELLTCPRASSDMTIQFREYYTADVIDSWLEAYALALAASLE